MWWLNNIDPEKLVTEANKSDIYFWQSNIAKDDYLGKIFGSKTARHYGADLFNVLNRLYPKMKDKPSDKAFAKWLNIFMQSSEYTKLHNKTVGKRDISAVATSRLYKEFTRYKEEITQYQQNNFRGRNAQQKRETAQYYIEQQRKQNQADKTLLENIHDIAEAKESAIDNDNKTLVTTHEQIQEALAQGLDNPEQALILEASMNNVSKSINKEIEAIVNITEVFGSGNGYSPEDSNDLVVADILRSQDKIASLDLNKVKRIAAIAGRMKQIMQSVKKTGLQITATPVNIVLGDNLQKLVSSEYGLLADSDTEDLFWHKYQNKSLLQYDTKTKEKEGKGPVVFCCDYSGSMTGEPLENALAMLIVIAREAIKDHRTVAFIPFASRTLDQPVIINKLQDLLGVIGATYSIGYGTDFEQPYNLAVKTIRQDKQMQKADVIFITDGICSIYFQFIQQFLKDKKELNFKNLGITISSRIQQDQICMYDGIMHMNPNDSELNWFTDMAKYLIDQK